MFINTNLFREAAIRFMDRGSYCDDPWGSPAWMEYWNEELRRCIDGYEVGGNRVTGDHYFYLNFCQILLTVEDNEKESISKKTPKRKTKTFPSFWDGDYEYFHVVEKCRKQGKHLIVGKTRRRGFSYKNAAICANRYNTQRDLTTIIGAFEKKFLYPTGTMAMASNYLNFLNEHTGWAKKRQYVDRQDHKKASYQGIVNGNPIEKGFKSEIIAVTFQDNPDAARGKDATLILFEEAGKFDNLKSSYLATKPTLEDGIHTIGMMIIFGTGGDMESSTIDFNELFYNPEPYNLMTFDNIWDEGVQGGTCGYFVPDYINKVGFMDEDGNSDREKAKEFEEARRAEISRTSRDKKVLIKHVTEYPFTPKEAFYLSSNNIFPTLDLKHRLGYLEANERIQNADFIGDLVIEDGKVIWKENLDLSPIKDFPMKADQVTEGAIVIYNQPYTAEGGKPPYGMYIAGIDPYDQDKSQTGSLGSTFVYDRYNKKIVAEYTARPATAKMYYENVRRLLMYYNAQALYENERKGIFDYFESKQCLYLLADEPEIIHDVIRDSRVSRKKGMHMTIALKDYGEELINSWLLENREDEDLNLHTIRSIPLIKELISYNEDDNFDRAIALMMVLYFEAEVRKQKVSKTTEIKTVLDDPFFANTNHFNKRVRETNQVFLR